MSELFEENETDANVEDNKRVRRRARPTSPSAHVQVTPIPDPQDFPAPILTEPIDLEPEGHGCCGYLFITLAFLFYLILFPLTVWFSFTVIQSYERGIVLRLGKLRKQNGSPILGSGIQFLLPFVDKMMKVDMRTVTVNIPPQDVLTRDSVTVGVDAIVYMRVIHPAQALLCVQNWSVSAEMLAVSLLRTVIGNYRLGELLSYREQIDAKLKKQLDEATVAWGINVSRMLV
ncbi:unnamed protein product [Echinostoma caproni]|uniref:PHB domain-containing protein n=1 Tax=Echinostoma caproni TaxID=27848 RepID=A0A183BAQ6_9TREM|nr:unnamed protein product [Echinostoma caproni]